MAIGAIGGISAVADITYPIPVPVSLIRIGYRRTVIIPIRHPIPIPIGKLRTFHDGNANNYADRNFHG